MARSPLSLAALATVAIPRLDVVDARAARPSGGDVDSAVVIDAAGRRWVVRAPRSSAAGAALEAEVALLSRLMEHVDADRLPFDVPRPVGFAPLPEGGRAVVHPQLKGRPLALELLGPGPGLAAQVGRAIGALHELPEQTVEDAGLPVYEAEAYRQRRLSEVDEAARTGYVPAGLLRRWERALEDVALWRFRPTVVHGDLSSEQVLCSREAPTGILGWSEAKVADPADDLAWLLVAAPQEAVDPIVEAYTLRRTETSDRHLVERAMLAGELALARWLLHGVRNDSAEVVDDATAMLVELDEQTSAEEAPVVTAPGFASAGFSSAGSSLEEDAAAADEPGPPSGSGPSHDPAPDGPEPDDSTPEGSAPEGSAPEGSAPEALSPGDSLGEPQPRS
ncbi:macrolide 2'-phosphotransferase [Actinotalea soli]|uniref:macrolide 2'-phosphotransferase n=1 Tax=Actinotalea soli TaxID=2819234 RepID=UPI0027DB4C2B|nr:macrolide 2'-phosphotransferase [Actinotalea soli]